MLKSPTKLDIPFNGSEFLMEGLSDIPVLQYPVFITFLFVYFLVIFGNIAIILIVCWNSHLHTPMYMFLMHLSIIDIAYTSNILPKLLNMLITRNHTISFWGCISQMYFFLALACTEVLLLAAMAYDRYVAICHPLHYVVLMSMRKSSVLAAVAWFIGFLDSSGHAVLISRLSFCATHTIDHFFCDIIPLLKISCSDTFMVEILNYFGGTLLLASAFILTLVSYVFIISTIIRIKSAEHQRKAFSTCSSHLTCVIMFYGTLICLYMRPKTSYTPEQDKYVSLLYAVLVPVLNPVIYSLKNEEVKSALIKFWIKLVCK